MRDYRFELHKHPRKQNNSFVVLSNHFNKVVAAVITTCKSDRTAFCEGLRLQGNSIGCSALSVVSI